MTDGRAVGVAVVGPTAVGKSDLAVALALRVGGEVVNADSMQLYRGMDIGTAKLRTEQRRGVQHHMLDVLDVRDEATVAAYRVAASAAVDEVVARGAVPVLVGGSGLYVASVLDGLEFQATDPQLRAQLEADLAEHGAAAMHARLLEVDPAAASVIPAANGRRVVRALEVVILTGRPYRTSLPPLGERDDPAVRWVRLGLTAPRVELDRRIGERVDRMWHEGLVAEVESLVGAGLREGPTAARALGYAQVLAMLDGEVDEPTARTQVVAATRRYVRRQESWFRRDPAVRWLGYDEPGLLDSAASAVLAVESSSSSPS